MWHFQCENDRCVKHAIQADTVDPMGLVRCRHTCGAGHRGLGVDVWPQLTGTIAPDDAADDVIHFQTIALETLHLRSHNVQTNNDFWAVNFGRVVAQCLAKRLDLAVNSGARSAHLANVAVDIWVESSDTRLRIGVNETYGLHVSGVGANNTITVRVQAPTIFGARHGLESLAQMIIYDDIRDIFLLRTNVRVADDPAYQHRGILLDTARNFYPVDAIKRTIGKQ